jgi:hypothetical protein
VDVVVAGAHEVRARVKSTGWRDFVVCRRLKCEPDTLPREAPNQHDVVHDDHELASDLDLVVTLPQVLSQRRRSQCEKLRLRFELVERDADLAKIKQRYLSDKELAFVDLEREFNATTDAVVIRLQHQPAWSNVRYVAVIDGRGAKQNRVWFSRWHEIAHLLAEPQIKFVFRRTQAFKREPVERLMDQIAGALAFYEPLFLPSLRRAEIDLARPTLRSLVTFATTACSHASLQATLMAALRHIERPAILIEAKPGLKTSERTAEARRRSRAQPKLRAISTGHNNAALRSRIFVHRNMRVPGDSVIAKVFAGEAHLEFVPHTECLSWWEESGGERLARQPVVVEAMSAGENRVLALCLPEYGETKRS